MKNLLFVVSTLQKGGPTKVLYDLILNLDRTLYKVSILTLTKEPINSNIQDFESLNITILSLNLSRLSFFLKGINNLHIKLDELKPDIIHTMGVRADYCVSLSNNFRKIQVSTLHCFAREEYTFVYGKLIGKYLSIKQEKAINLINYPIFCSSTIENKYRTIVFNKNMKTIKNGISFDQKTYSLKNRKEEIRLKLKIPLGADIFIIVGRLTPHKNPEIVINSFIKSNRPNSYLYVLGDGILYDKIYRKFYKNKKVYVLGRVSNVNDYLFASDYFISASKTEGLPLAVIEAGMFGLTLILSNIPQHEELIEQNKHGLFFNLDHSIQLPSIILNVKKMNENQIASYFYQYFRAEIMAKNYNIIYEKI